MSGKRPDFDVVMQKKTQGSERGPSARVGAAWRITKRDTGDDTGGISIEINVPVVMSPGWRLALWPSRDNTRSTHDNKAASTPPPADEFGDDDIPF